MPKVEREEFEQIVIHEAIRIFPQLRGYATLPVLAKNITDRFFGITEVVVEPEAKEVRIEQGHSTQQRK